MSNVLRNIRKNANEYAIDKLYANMTPEQYKQGIDMALAMQRKDFERELDIKLNKLEKHYNESIKSSIGATIDTLSIELLYELLNQMDYWNRDDEYIKEQIEERAVQIYENTMASITRYADLKKKGQATKEFNEKKKKLAKFLKV